MEEPIIARKLKTLIAFRVFFVTVLLGTFFVFQIGYNFFPFPASVLDLVIFLYVLSIVYSLLLGRVDNRKFAHLQLSLDSVSVVVLIFMTGGIESWFSSLMILVVIAAAIILGRNAGYFNAIFSSILYGFLVDLQFYGLVPIPFDHLLTERDFLFNIFSHMLALYLTAYLIGYLMIRLEMKETDIEDLTLFNREVIENTPSGLFTTDLAGRIRIFNRAAESITGMSRAEAHGRKISDVFPFITRLEQKSRMEEVLECQEGKRILGLSISKMQDAKGTDIGFIGIFQDLTELKQMSEEIQKKEKWAAIGELSANIAHEIRNPLASLKSSIEMLRESAIPTQKKEKLMSIAISEMDRLNNIIVDFLTYSRPSVLDMSECDLAKILDKTLDLVRSSRPDEVTITKDYPTRLEMWADTRKLEQVFLNLGVNALEAMPRGGRLEVSASSKNDIVEISFKDTGTGISPADREKVFYPFFTTKPSGTGLGLSIAHRIIEDHKGHIFVASTPGAGTIFSITMPRGNANGKG